MANTISIADGPLSDGESCYIASNDGRVVHIPLAQVIRSETEGGRILYAGELYTAVYAYRDQGRAIEQARKNASWCVDYHRKHLAEAEAALAALPVPCVVDGEPVLIPEEDLPRF